MDFLAASCCITFVFVRGAVSSSARDAAVGSNDSFFIPSVVVALWNSSKSFVVLLNMT